MRRPFLILALAASAFAQTSPYPTSLDSTATLGVSADNVFSALTAPMLIGATSATVANGTNIPQWSIITFGSEQMQVCSKSGNTLTFGTSTVCPSISGRGLSGTTVAAHNTGTIGYLNVNSWYQKAASSAIRATQTALGASLSAIKADYDNYADAAMFTWHGATGLVGSTPQNIVIIGDSTGECYNASTYAQGWAGLLATAVQQAYGNAGLGLFTLAPASHCGVTWALAGSWTSFYPNGPGLNFASSYSASGGGNTATLSNGMVICDSFDVYYYTSTDSGTFTVAIDGGAATPVVAGTSVSVTAAKVNISAGTYGLHSIVITAPASGKVYLQGVAPVTGTAGVAIHNLSRSGAITADFGSADSQLALLSAIQPRLTIVSLGINDANAGVSLSSVSANMTRIIAAARVYGSVIVLDENPISGGSLPSYQTVNRAAALAGGAAYLSVSDRWGTYSAANTLGLMSDVYHPNDAGHLDIARMLISRLVAHPDGPAGPNPVLAKASTPFEYMNLNRNSNASTTLLNGGLCLYCSDVQTFGMDLGYSGGAYSTRLFAPVSQRITFSKAASYARNQASFTDMGWWDTNKMRFVTAGAAAANVNKYALFNGSGNVSTTLMNGGILVYENLAFGVDLGYSAGNYSLRLFAPATKHIVFSRGADAPTAQSDFTDLMDIDTSTGIVSVTSLKTTGSAGSKKVVCVDTSNGKLYASSTGTDCSN